MPYPWVRSRTDIRLRRVAIMDSLPPSPSRQDMDSPGVLDVFGAPLATSLFGNIPDIEPGYSGDGESPFDAVHHRRRRGRRRPWPVVRRPARLSTMVAILYVCCHCDEQYESAREWVCRACGHIRAYPDGWRCKLCEEKVTQEAFEGVVPGSRVLFGRDDEFHVDLGGEEEEEEDPARYVDEWEYEDEEEEEEGGEDDGAEDYDGDDRGENGEDYDAEYLDPEESEHRDPEESNRHQTEGSRPSSNTGGVVSRAAGAGIGRILPDALVAPSCAPS